MSTMDPSIGSTIEKIKLQEQEKEARLKEERDYEAAIALLNREIKNKISETHKSTQEQLEITKRIEKLRPLLIIQKLKRDALLVEINKFTKTLADLKSQSDEGIKKVWSLRSSLCDTVKNVSDHCDIRALLTRPMCIDPLPLPLTKHAENEKNIAIHEGRLKAALERREKAIAERKKLLSEPDTSEEFIRKLLRSYDSKRVFSSNVEANENIPIKFSTSPAAKRRVTPIVRNKHAESMPWYQPFSVVGSVAVFLIYFCILREENDLDQEFDKTLYDRIKGLEKAQLLQSYQYNKEHGKSVEDIEKRLKEIEENAAKQATVTQ